MTLNVETNNYLEDYCNNFVNENITKPIFEFSEEQLKEFLRDYLSEMGYSKDRAEVILRITTDGANVDLDKYLKDYENNEFAAKESQEYSFYQDVLSFNGVHYGDDILLIKELLGKPSYEETGYCNYYFYKENKSIFLEFRYTDDGKFLSACFDYIMEEK